MCACLLLSVFKGSFDEDLFKCQHYLLVTCSVLNVYKVVKARNGSLPLALAMVTPFPIWILPLYGCFVDVCFFLGSFIHLLYLLEECLFGITQLKMHLLCSQFCLEDMLIPLFFCIYKLTRVIVVQGLFVTIWHHRQLSTFSHYRNRTYFRISCGKIAVLNLKNCCLRLHFFSLSWSSCFFLGSYYHRCLF